MKLKRFISLFLAFLLFTVQLCVPSVAEEQGEADGLPEFIILDFTEYEDGVVNGVDSAELEQVFIDGRKAMKIVPNPDCESTSTLALDGYSYSGAGVDVRYYKWAAVEYFYDSQEPPKVQGIVTVQANGGILTKSVDAKSTEVIKGGKWDCMYFNLTGVQNVINHNAANLSLYQMHIRPFGLNTLKKLSPDEPLYISKVIFFREKPDITYRDAYLEGYEDGTFKPSEFLTRAEACAIVARQIESDDNISGTPSFADIPSEAWYAKHVGFLEEKGMLSFSGALFEPDAKVTAAEFTRLCAMALSLDAAGELPGSDTGNSLPKASGNEYISRGQAAAIINAARGSVATASEIAGDAPLLFLDVTTDTVYYADIARAAIAHAERNSSWYFPFQDSISMLAEKIGYDVLYNTDAGNAKVAELDKLENKRIAAIRSYSSEPPEVSGKTYYVSVDGDDSNGGLSEDMPKRTIAAANALARSGDAVLLRCGDTWREKISAKSGVTYSSYGYGEKPKLFGSPENGAGASKWTLVYENKETGALIWKYYREDFVDVGTLVFNDGEGFARKELPSCVGADYYVRGQEYLPVEERTPFDYRVELDNNLEFFHAANSVTKTSATIGSYIDAYTATGPLYLRCDNGNPGKVFSSIEFNTKGHIISIGGDGVTIDNLCLKYTGSHGISSGTVKNLTVTNCEIGWIGGAIQGYTANGSTNRAATRFGNGVEIYGGCDGYVIDNCYIYQCYDAGVTHQYSGSATEDCVMLNVTYSNNVITECVYSIEYFLGTAEGLDRRGDNILFEGNLLRRAGYGFGSVRPDGRNQRHIRSSSRDNPFTNYRIVNNIFDRSVHQLIYANTPYKDCIPVMSGNTYIQGVGNYFYHVGTSSASTDVHAASNVKNVLGDTTGEMFFVSHIPYYEYDYTPSKTVPVTDSDRT